MREIIANYGLRIARVKFAEESRAEIGVSGGVCGARVLRGEILAPVEMMAIVAKRMMVVVMMNMTMIVEDTVTSLMLVAGSDDNGDVHGEI